MVDGNKIIIIFYFIYCVCANYKCCIMPSRGPDLENKVSCISNFINLGLTAIVRLTSIYLQKKIQFKKKSSFQINNFFSRCILIRPNNLSLLCLYLSFYISFLLFGHIFFVTLTDYSVYILIYCIY